MSSSMTDVERAFYIAQAGLTEEAAAKLTLPQLRQAFQALAWIKAANPKPTVVVAPAASALYTQANLQSIVNTVNGLRTALIDVGLIQ